MKKRSKTKSIVIHHSASPKSTTKEQIWKWHVQDRKWSDIGYHWIVNGDTGEWTEGRDEWRQGAHCPALNSVSVGICLTGNYETEPVSKVAWDGLLQLIETVIERYDLSWSDVTWHKEHGKTACPGKNLEMMLKDYKIRHK